MAELLLKLSSAAAVFLLAVLSLASSFATVEAKPFSRNLSPLSLGINKPEKLSHLHFYFHDIVAGKNATAVRVAKAETTSASSPFGAVAVIDDPLTVGPDIGSKLVGRAQGIYALTSKTESSLLMAYNFAFMEGKYNGSSLTVMGRNPVLSAVREMPVMGGSGVFRFARGYVEARTHTFDLKTGDACVEYDVYVYHY
ncbi:Dirigent protein 21 [Hibiscus syriacus]|uniref:Dirigent protein n=1 Tax=Hibiscus syriacus TaxID=106335 RepID=A0A6A2WTF8_HIBSY|nr:dirigent protein 22-like [Hibiscus syriacus]KAE8664198.1 Dirigent protein 21 [Hibiscus syriacus]